ncbi:unnamed protein product [Brassicogethes aeneus]|uniref:MADF domain-containing protein n=1 Tax=Brassicogethes aeneus TaxID=1431903 RepID=A0A9P0BIW6_BRAAE|nr:unnamed protein product [Brassicogethes aeneus]
MDDGELIRLVQGFENIYDKKNKMFKDIQAKRNSWNTIRQILNPNEEITVEAVEKRWAYLRQKYTQVRKEVLCQPSGSGGKPRCKWPYFDQMGFLDNFIQGRRRSCNYTKNKAACSNAEEISQEHNVLEESPQEHCDVFEEFPQYFQEEASEDAGNDDLPQTSQWDTLNVIVVEDEAEKNIIRPVPKADAEAKKVGAAVERGRTGLLRRQGTKRRATQPAGPSEQTMDKYLQSLTAYLDKENVSAQDDAFTNALGTLVGGIRNKSRRRLAKRQILRLAATFNSTSEDSESET